MHGQTKGEKKKAIGTRSGKEKKKVSRRNGQTQESENETKLHQKKNLSKHSLWRLAQERPPHELVKRHVG